MFIRLTIGILSALALSPVLSQAADSGKCGESFQAVSPGIPSLVRKSGWGLLGNTYSIPAQVIQVRDGHEVASYEGTLERTRYKNALPIVGATAAIVPNLAFRVVRAYAFYRIFDTSPSHILLDPPSWIGWAQFSTAAVPVAVSVRNHLNGSFANTLAGLFPGKFTFRGYPALPIAFLLRSMPTGSAVFFHRKTRMKSSRWTAGRIGRKN